MLKNITVLIVIINFADISENTAFFCFTLLTFTTDLILGGLVSVPPLVSPPDSHQESGPSAGLNMIMSEILEINSRDGLP